MKKILGAASLLALVAMMTPSCSVERKTRDGKKNVIDVGMNKTEKQTNQSTAKVVHYDAATAGR